LTFLVGASGSGKSTLAKVLSKDPAFKGWSIHFFDSIIGEPGFKLSEDPEDDWQRRATLEWCRRAAALKTRKKVLIDGQTQFEFVSEGCAAAGMPTARVILVHCDWEERKRRLAGRGQPELAHEDMKKWSAWLKRDAKAKGLDVLDTSGLDLAKSVKGLKRLLK